MTEVIGVVGGYGDVGSHASRRLAASFDVRVGGRDPHAARMFAESIGARHQRVDFTDQSSLATFAEGCRVLLNCAGPSNLVRDSLARAARRAGADYVDAAGDDLLYELLNPADYTQGRAVLSAGLRPGLTGLLPRAIATEPGLRMDELTVSFGLRDRFTPTSAADFLQAAADKLTRPLAAWRDGPREGALTRRTETDLPFFPGEVTLTPMLSTEDERLAKALGLARGEWYSVLGGEQVRAAFDLVHTLDRDRAVALLCRASQLDLTGRPPYVTIVAHAGGEQDGARVHRTAVLNGAGNAVVSGAVAALTVSAVVRGDVPAGRHYAADVVDPVWALRELEVDGAVRVEYLSTGAAELVEEGVL